MIMILTFILVTLFAVSAVSAAENVTDDAIGMEMSNDASSAENDIKTVAEDNGSDVGTFDELSDQINSSAIGGVLNLTKDYKFVNGDNNGIMINKTITINGNNHKLDGNNQSRIFALFDGNITLNNLVLVNGFADNGGAIFVNKTVTCNNVVFENNYAKKGGAIYTNSNITLDNCIFNGGYAEYGAAIYAHTPPHRKNMKYMAL
jgi:predicted outer membrane repeat protein